MTAKIWKFDRVAALSCLLILFVSGCGQVSETSSVTTGAPTLTAGTISETTTGGSTSVTTAPDDSPTSIRANELDVPRARAALNDAESRWDQTAVSDYIIEYENSTTSVTVEVLAGSPVDVSQVNSAGDFGLATTVDDMFVRIDELISEAEANPSSIGDEEEDCNGLFFDIAFDGETGAPLLLDQLTPCEDGDPFWSSVTPTG